MEDNTYHWPGNDPKPKKERKLPDFKRIVKNILESHGLSYGVESCEGRGSTFWFELPCVNE